jgi:hypothetical protein
VAQFGGALIQSALQSAADPMVQVPRVIQQMRRVARAAEVRAASELEAAHVCVEVLPTDGEVRWGYPTPPPPARLEVELRVPPLAQLQMLAARRKPGVPKALMSPGAAIPSTGSGVKNVHWSVCRRNTRRLAVRGGQRMLLTPLSPGTQ